jgi:hypothetical protein
MAKKIVEIYYVLHGQPKGGRKIKDYIVPRLIPPFVRSGDTFTINHKKIGYDPFPSQQKDLIIVMTENGAELPELRHCESKLGTKPINILIP